MPPAPGGVGSCYDAAFSGREGAGRYSIAPRHPGASPSGPHSPKTIPIHQVVPETTSCKQPSPPIRPPRQIESRSNPGEWRSSKKETYRNPNRRFSKYHQETHLGGPCRPLPASSVSFPSSTTSAQPISSVLLERSNLRWSPSPAIS